MFMDINISCRLYRGRVTYSPVPELNLLMAFQDEHGYESYSECFGLDDWNDASGLTAGWSKDPAFLARLTPFARATGGGSFYALWDAGDGTRPVVVFGDEGGEHVVARDVRELFQLLTFDSEPMVDHDGVTFYRSADDEHSDAHDEFVTWLQAHFGLPATDDPERIVGAAQAEYGERFTTWKSAYLDC
ncbi:hypothetical protein SAMN05421541_10873 [Actinoplanes philippinensis]|uniref:Uncharacterized protein n=1 Tax=Actinoplanes philippinensis TaxID=35752 RepID=A0A1I2HEE1_9ACTN|nr:hypothetical protein SAMN05421541_10873 [Actinoplanes philippinensis]